MRIIFAGTPEIAVVGLGALIKSEHEIVGVLTREDAPVGRKKVLTASPVAGYAEDQGLNVLKKNRLDDETTEWLKSLNADLGVVIAYGGLLKKGQLEAPRLGWINLHFSMLPSWRGAAPVQRALMAGETSLGISVFRLDEGLDSGALLETSSVEFAPGVSAGEALTELAGFGVDPLLKAIETLAKDEKAGRGQTGEPTFAPKIARDEAKIDFKGTAHKELARWAGVTPEPGAFAELNGANIKLTHLKLPGEAQTAQALSQNLKPGEMRLIMKRALLGFSEGFLVVEKVQPAGKKVMAASDWLRGLGGEVQLS